MKMEIMRGDLMIRIHYIEDNLIDQHALMREIQKHNLPYQIDLSSSLAEARERTQHYDLILCDYFLSDGTILDILPSLIDDHTPVIVLTGQADLNNAVTALKLGAKDYLVKDPERQYLSILPIQIDNLIWHQQIERDRRWLSTLLFSISGAIPFGIYLYEPETGRVAYANNAFFTLWNLAHNEDQSESYSHTQVSRHISMMVESGSDGGSIFPPFPAGVGESASGEVRVRGSKIFRYYSARIPLDPGVPACYVGIFEDTTELSRARDAVYEYSRELELLNETLDQRVHDRTRQIEDLMQKKSELILHIGHDLRTPLTPLVALLPYLQQSEQDPEKKQILGVLCEGMLRIRSLVEKTLLMGELGNDRLPDNKVGIESCDLLHMVHEVIQTYLPIVGSKDLRIQNNISAAMQIQVKRTHLHLILDNLIHNAIQFTGPGGMITLNGGSDGSDCWFCISDTGIGLTPEDANRIFDEFYKADSSRNNLQSHGLGLSVVKKLVLMNHGQITVKSGGLGMGSRFCVLLPDPQKRMNSTRYGDNS